MSDDCSGAPESTYVVVDAVSAQTITRSLQALLPTRHSAIGRQRFTVLDTYDGRVSRAGARLTQSSLDGRSIVSWKSGGAANELAVQLPRPASFAWDLPDGLLYRAVAPVIGPRRLLPQAEAEGSGSLLDVLDDRGKTVARVSVESGQARLPTPRGAWHALPTIVTLSGLRGYARQYERLVPVIQSRPGVRLCPEGVNGILRQQIGVPEPRDVSSLGLDLTPGVRADVGARQIHLGLLDVMQGNQFGLLANLDSEFLHDFRVAVRRTRSLLGQIRQVFDEDRVQHFSNEFSWLGKLTGPPRDLDVLILTLRHRRRAFPLEGVDECIALLERMQHDEHTKLIGALNSDRFHKLTSEWRDFLGAPVSLQPSPENARRRLADVICERAWQLSRKIRRSAAALDVTTSPEAVHDLRVKAKKLRYLVDVAPMSGNATEAKRVLVALKSLQRVLGDFNDAHVQAHRLIEYRGAMAVMGAADESLSAIARLAEEAGERTGQLRNEVLEEAQRFSCGTVVAACRQAFKRTTREVRGR